MSWIQSRTLQTPIPGTSLKGKHIHVAAVSLKARFSFVEAAWTRWEDTSYRDR